MPVRNVIKGPPATTANMRGRHVESPRRGIAITEPDNRAPENWRDHLPCRRIARKGPSDPPKRSKSSSAAAAKWPASCKRMAATSAANNAPRASAPPPAVARKRICTHAGPSSFRPKPIPSAAAKRFHEIPGWRLEPAMRPINGGSGGLIAGALGQSTTVLSSKGARWIKRLRGPMMSG